jgi:hypothetical protein
MLLICLMVGNVDRRIDYDIGVPDRAGPNVDAEVREHQPSFAVEACMEQLNPFRALPSG